MLLFCMTCAFLFNFCKRQRVSQETASCVYIVSRIGVNCMCCCSIVFNTCSLWRFIRLFCHCHPPSRYRETEDEVESRKTCYPLLLIVISPCHSSHIVAVFCLVAHSFDHTSCVVPSSETVLLVWWFQAPPSRSSLIHFGGSSVRIKRMAR